MPRFGRGKFNMARLDQERQKIANEVLESPGHERTLSRRQARSFVRCLQTAWEVETIYWGKNESNSQFADALRLVHAARIFNDVEGFSSLNARRCYRRAGELLEWLSRADDPIQNFAPISLLAAGAYQLGGLPAMASGLLIQEDTNTSGAELYGLFLRADFNGVLNSISRFWRTNISLTHPDSKEKLLAEENGFDFPWFITVELVRALGLISDCIRRGDEERFQIGMKKLKAIEQATLRGASPDASLLVSLLHQVALSFHSASIYAPINELAESAPEKSSQLNKIARNQFHRGRGILWASQHKGLKKLLTQSSFAMCTPTGSGKTLVANLAMVKELLLQNDGLQAPLALYLVPSRALAGEVEAKLSNEMKDEFIITGLYGGTDWGVTDAWLTAERPTVLIATVEKAEALMRYLGPFIIPRMKILIIDEAHQVVPENSKFIKTAFASHSERSIRLEFFVSRLLIQAPNIARVALTAVAGGAAGPVARWVEQNAEAAPVGLNYRSTRQLVGTLRTRSTYRAKIQLDLINNQSLRVENDDGKREAVYINLQTPPMPLLPAPMRDSMNKFNQIDVLWTSLHLKAAGKRILISLAQQPEKTFGWFADALLLPNWAKIAQFDTPKGENLSIYEETLAACADYCGVNAYEGILLRHGIATSHGQMPQRLRRLMTLLIEKGICPITVATATLTEGVNLPFDLIFIPQLKRSFFNPVTKRRELKPFSASEFNNLSGRAGRPGAANGMEGITLIPLPAEPATTAPGSILTQKTQLLEMRNDYKELRKSLLDEENVSNKSESPLALLLTTLKEKTESVLGLDTNMFIEWLEVAQPAQISDKAATGDKSDPSILADTLDELDGILLSAVEEIDRLGDAEIDGPKAEEFLAALWARTFSSIAAEQEAWLETAFIKRGAAIVETIYPDAKERKRLYNYGFPPHLGRRFEAIVEPLKAILGDSVEYGLMPDAERFEIFKMLGALMKNNQGFGFQIKDSVAEKNLLENWDSVLGWWMNLENSDTPEPTKLRSWQRFVSDNLEFRLGVSIGAVVANAWTEGVNDPLTAPSLEDWKQTTKLPWFSFWARELLRWGTLDPFVAFCLAQGIAKTRDSAAKKRPEFDLWLNENCEEITGEELIDPQLFLEWHRSKPRPLSPEDTSKTYAAELTGSNGAQGIYAVIPVKYGARILWLDAAGYELARSDIPKTGTRGLTIKSDYRLITVKGAIHVERHFDGRKHS